MKINEIFYSIEGEGLRMGQPTIFVRLQGCPYRCTYCDTPKAQDPAGGKDMSVAAVVEAIADMRTTTGCHTVEFTGGSPELQLDDIVHVIEDLELGLHGRDWKYVFQVSGAENLSYVRNNMFPGVPIQFAYDFKINQGIPFRVDPHQLGWNDEVKFVIDMDWVKRVRDMYEQDMEIQDSPLFDTIAGIDYILQQSLAQVIITSVSHEGRPEQWKELTEYILHLMGTFVDNCDRVHILPRLQQLYWPYQEGK